MIGTSTHVSLSSDEQRRRLACRVIVYVAPILIAAITVALLSLIDIRPSTEWKAWGAILGNGVLSALLPAGIVANWYPVPVRRGRRMMMTAVFCPIVYSVTLLLVGVIDHVYF